MASQPWRIIKAIGAIWLPTYLASRIWLNAVRQHVPEPYLDEVFHVRQAQIYCSGDFHTWDPKITTPPGVYLLSYIYFKLSGKCETKDLRSLNQFSVPIIAFLSYIVLGFLSPKLENDPSHLRGSAIRRRIHTAINISLFPPLFFFSALYYTDISSTLLVLFTFAAFQSSLDKGPNIRATLRVFICGVASLLFRQTNIFWVAVFPAALTILHRAKSGSQLWRISPSLAAPRFDAVVKAAWGEAKIYDPPVADAEIEDYVKAALSFLVVVLKHFPSILTSLAPYAAILAVFGSFVLWNGGVVLGDKSNHVATLHIPQMLYLWPYMLFFSHTLAIPTAAAMLLSVSTMSTVLLLKRLEVLSAFTVGAMFAIHFNTIIHPFTLADNRHYVFYVFKLIRNPPAMRYLLAPIYTVSGWIIIQTLGFPRIRPRPGSALKARREEKKLLPAAQGCTVSFVLAWLATATLSLVSAPLVEPRYCILPWVFWRLYVPQFTTAELLGDEVVKGQPLQGWLGNLWETLKGEDLRLWLETAFFLIINTVTGYVFLTKGFEWPQEPGEVQRFMW